MTWNGFIVICFLGLSINYANAFTPKVDQAYKVSLWAKVPRPQQMAYNRKNLTLYVASHESGGSIFKIKKGKIEKLIGNLNSPSSLIIYKDDLYFSEINKISFIKNITAYDDLKNPPKVIVLKSGLPEDYQNSLKRILIHKDSIYLSIGAACNVCIPVDPYGSILKISLDGKQTQTIARGIRHAGFLTAHPETSKIWFSDFNREKLGSNRPAAEINILEDNLHYGFPYLHATDTKDNFFYSQKPKDLSFTLPKKELAAHSRPTAMVFKEKTNCAFLVLNGFKHEGVWQEPKVVESCEIANKWIDKTILEGFLEKNQLRGRPFDIISLNGKEFLVSDEHLGLIWSLKLK